MMLINLVRVLVLLIFGELETLKKILEICVDFLLGFHVRVTLGFSDDFGDLDEHPDDVVDGFGELDIDVLVVRQIVLSGRLDLVVRLRIVLLEEVSDLSLVLLENILEISVGLLDFSESESGESDLDQGTVEMALELGLLDLLLGV